MDAADEVLAADVSLGEKDPFDQASPKQHRSLLEEAHHHEIDPTNSA